MKPKDGSYGSRSHRPMLYQLSYAHRRRSTHSLGHIPFTVKWVREMALRVSLIGNADARCGGDISLRFVDSVFEPRSLGKIVVSHGGEAYDAQAKSPDRKARAKILRSRAGDSLL